MSLQLILSSQSKAAYGLSGYTPYAAYSLRKLINSYNGSCLRMRRSSDNLESDIGFVYSPSKKQYVVDYNAITNFCGTYNMLLNSEDATATGWTTNSVSVSQVAVTNPFGGSTCSQIIGTGIEIQHNVSASVTTANTAPVTASVYAKAGTNNFLQIRFSAAINGGDAANFDLVGGTCAAMPFSGSGITDVSMKDVGNGWWRCSVRTTNNAYAGTGGIGFYLITSLSSVSNEVNTLSTSIYICGAQLQTGSLVNYTKTGVGQSGSGFVTTWYSQNSVLNLIQASANSQPSIMLNGVLNTLNDFPIIRPNSTSGGAGLQSASFSLSQSDTIIIVGNGDGGGSNRRFIDGTGGGRQIVGCQSSNGKIEMYAGTDVSSGSAPALGTSPHIFSAIFNGASSLGYIDGTQQLSSNIGSMPLAPLNLFHAGATYVTLTMGIIELIAFSGILSDDLRLFLERNQGKTYGIAVS